VVVTLLVYAVQRARIDACQIRCMSDSMHVRFDACQIRCMSDSIMETITPAQMLGSPQRSVNVSPTPKQVYVLTYIKDDIAQSGAQRKALRLESQMT
jgi:hypothetical protein